MKRLQVLLVEDNDGDVILVQEALVFHQIEHDLHAISDGEAALDHIMRIGTAGGPPCPDVMLVDLNLPKLDGMTLLSELRKRPDCLQVPIIVITSSDANRDRAEVGACRLTKYFRKPSDFDAFMELGALVREAVEGR